MMNTLAGEMATAWMMEERGLDPLTISEWSLGLAPDVGLGVAAPTGVATLAVQLRRVRLVVALERTVDLHAQRDQLFDRGVEVGRRNPRRGCPRRTALVDRDSKGRGHLPGRRLRGRQGGLGHRTGWRRSGAEQGHDGDPEAGGHGDRRGHHECVTPHGRLPPDPSTGAPPAGVDIAPHDRKR